VRLKPTSDDIYTWQRIDSKDHLFSRNISDHSIRSLKELYREVGESFEAVGRGNSQVLENGIVTSVHCPNGGDSFHSRIIELQRSLAIQMSELKEYHNKAESESVLRHQAEAKVEELERRLQTILNDNQRLKVNVQDWKLVAERHEKRKEGLEQATQKILACLEEVAAEPDR
jgi:chromosome segregation ATPase